MTARQPTDLDDFSGEPRSLDLRDYWLIIRRRAVLVVVLTVLGAIAGAGYAVLSGYTYAATAQVLVTPPQGPLTSYSAQQIATQANMTTEQAVAQSPPVVRQAARLLHVRPSALQAEAAKDLRVNVPATTLTTSNVLQISWQARSAAAAQAGANAFANAYLSYRRQLIASQVQSLTADLNRRLALVEIQITMVHSQLNQAPAKSPRHQNLALKLKQLESAQTAYNGKLASISIYNASGGSMIGAARPLTPTSLGHKVILVLGGLLGLLIGLVLAFVRDAFDDRIRDSAQFEQKLGALTLAVLPPDASIPDDAREAGKRAQRRRPSVIVTAASPESQAAEAVRTLRAMVAAMAVRRQLRTLLVVAADASVSAGKLAAELGVALAQSGRGVLLVAADLRGSTLPQIFDVSNDAGLSDLLVGGGDPEVLMRTPHRAAGTVLPGQVARRLTVLPRGPQLAYALAAMDSSAMRRLLHGARESYDFVLLDSPPATVAADAYELAANVDGVIVAARERHTRGRAVEELSRRLDRIGATLVGGVFIGKDRAGRDPRRPGGAAPARGVELARSVPDIAAEGQRPQQLSGTGRSADDPPATRPLPPVPDGARSRTAASLTERPNGT
jgi:Mrp family chromosome partitioning ATPase/capsular polysaccharide biosynthesis protein